MQTQTTGQEMRFSVSDIENTPSFQRITEMRERGTALDLEGKSLPYTELFNPADGIVLYNLIREYRPKALLEIGMAKGTSTLYMLQALADNGEGGKLITVDMNQMTVDNGAGIRNVQECGFAEFHEVVDSSSEIVLPAMLKEKFNFDFAFIDSNHLYDQTMIEAFYIRQLLPVGAIMAFDDYPMPSITTACNYLESNMEFAVHPLQGPRLRVLQKTKEDDREWHHFVPFDVKLPPNG